MRRNCECCDKGVPIVIGKTDDIGVKISFPDYLVAYGYDVRGPNSNAILAKINYCPMCGRKLKTYK